MFKDTIKYTDYNDVERSMEVYFNLTKAEIVEMELSVAGGFSEMLMRLVELDKVPEIMREFKNIIKCSYGVKSPDGKRFIKSEELTEEFLQTEAYTEFFLKLLNEDGYAVKFINALAPADIEVGSSDENPKIIDLKERAAELIEGKQNNS